METRRANRMNTATTNADQIGTFSFKIYGIYD